MDTPKRDDRDFTNYCAKPTFEFVGDAEMDSRHPRWV